MSDRRPPIRSFIAGVRLYGTWSIFTPAVCAKSSANRCAGLPMPGVPYDSSPGFAFAAATMSAIDLNGDVAGTMTTLFVSATSATGTRSRSEERRVGEEGRARQGQRDKKDKERRAAH